LSELLGPILSVRDLRVRFHTDEGALSAVNGVSFDLEPGRALALVGESGSGKSVTSLALMGLLDAAVTSVSGSVQLAGRELVGLDERALRPLRGRDIAMVFQDPTTSLNPFLTVGRQLSEVLEVHERLSRKHARRRSIALLERVGIADPARRFDHYPHQFSGGMRQRVMIAMAVLCRPKVLIADEPTTALDVTIQAQIIDLLRELAAENNTAILFVTHDLGVVASFADDVAVMYAGRVVEQATTVQLFADPQHPYTQGLLRSVWRIDGGDGLHMIPGRPPDGFSIPTGCAFHPRCDEADLECAEEVPRLLVLDDGRRVACPFARAVLANQRREGMNA